MKTETWTRYELHSGQQEIGSFDTRAAAEKAAADRALETGFRVGGTYNRVVEVRFGRAFCHVRKAQGFKSQAHLDAFFAASDHTATCAACRTAGTPVWIGDGMQPTMNRCAEGRRLDAISFSF